MRAAQATGEHWGIAATASIEALGPPLAGANLGILYVTEGLAGDLPSIATFLRNATGIADWVGAAGFGVFGPLGEVYQRPAMALMTACVPEGAVRLFDGFDAADSFRADHQAWLAGQTAVSGLVHASAREPRLPALLAELADAARAFLVGGLTPAADSPTLLAGRVTDQTLAGVLFGDGVELAVGHTQGCAPMGPAHRVTDAVENVVMELDGRPAVDLLKDEAGDLIARDLRRAAGLIHVALPIEGSDTHDYLVRNLMAIDPTHGWIAVGAQPRDGDRLLFVRRDPNAAQQDMRRMLAGLARRVGSRRIQGGVYVSCIGRGPFMFGQEGREVEMIHEALGDFPLIGFAANGEFSLSRLYTYTGVLTLFL
jgi:small ligand-binding sensory domain FIST